jgi:hypothetical protein
LDVAHGYALKNGLIADIIGKSRHSRLKAGRAGASSHVLVACWTVEGKGGFCLLQFQDWGAGAAFKKGLPMSRMTGANLRLAAYYLNRLQHLLAAIAREIAWRK